MTYTTAAQDAAKVRKQLKDDHGWTSRQISVRCDNYSMGSSVHVTVKDATIDLNTVETVAKQVESISRCEVTGEILSGGNRYVSVNYSNDAAQEIADSWNDAVSEALDGATALPADTHAEVDCNQDVTIACNTNGGPSLWINGTHHNVWSNNEITAILGRVLGFRVADTVVEDDPSEVIAADILSAAAGEDFLADIDTFLASN